MWAEPGRRGEGGAEGVWARSLIVIGGDHALGVAQELGGALLLLKELAMGGANLGPAPRAGAGGGDVVGGELFKRPGRGRNWRGWSRAGGAVLGRAGPGAEAARAALTAGVDARGLPPPLHARPRPRPRPGRPRSHEPRPLMPAAPSGRPPRAAPSCTALAAATSTSPGRRGPGERGGGGGLMGALEWDRGTASKLASGLGVQPCHRAAAAWKRGQARGA